ncbi:MAG: hypothetical protein IJY25_06065 [Bacilli bacterium]|nr:hypothetical protein [Bacilli bacterium]
MDYFKQKERGKLIYLYKEYNTNAFLKKAEAYLKIYPDDIDIRYKRATIYRRLEKFEEAIEELKYSLNIKHDSNCLSALYFIYYHLNMYKEALELVPVLYEKGGIDPYSVSITELVMKKALDIPIKVKKGTRGDYIRTQIFSYSSTLAFEHIQEHLYNPEQEAKFNENVDVAYLLNTVRNNIDNSKKLNINEVLEVHNFAIPNIGNNKGNVCNYIKVVVVPNTNHVVTIYPTDSVIFSKVSDLEYDYNLLFRKEEPKVKRISQIDKFNSRYKRV